MRFLIVVLVGIAPKIVFGQFDLSVNSGYGFYSMNDMKSFQEHFASAFPVSPQITSSFPAYWFYEINSRWTLKNNLVIGNSFSYGSTGGRIYYSDYSGSIGSDQLLDAYSFAIIIGKIKSYRNNKLIVQYDIRPGFTVSHLKLTAYETLGGVSQSDQTLFKSFNATLQPTITITRRFGWVGINALIGYNLTVLAGKLKTDGGYLQNNQNEVHADWSGLRIGGGIVFYFEKLAKEK